MAHEISSGETLALKVFCEKHAQQLFQTEALALQRLPSHPAIPQFRGTGTIRGRQFLATQYLPYPNLETHLETVGALDVVSANRIVAQLVVSSPSPSYS